MGTRVEHRSIPGIDPTCTPAKLTVNILDVNDNTPQFKPLGITYYTERVLEGATPGTTLIAVAAVDPDKGLNGLITYTLLDLTPPGYVQLEDSSTGRWGVSQEGRGGDAYPCLLAPRGTVTHFSISSWGPTPTPVLWWPRPDSRWLVYQSFSDAPSSG